MHNFRCLALKLAPIAVSGANAEAGVQIALVHLLFNLVGICMVYPVGVVRKFPLRAARFLARTAVESRAWAIAYVLLLFYALPAVLIYVDNILP